jgi:hypothetical protein
MAIGDAVSNGKKAPSTGAIVKRAEQAEAAVERLTKHAQTARANGGAAAHHLGTAATTVLSAAGSQAVKAWVPVQHQGKAKVANVILAVGLAGMDLFNTLRGKKPSGYAAAAANGILAAEAGMASFEAALKMRAQYAAQAAAQPPQAAVQGEPRVHITPQAQLAGPVGNVREVLPSHDDIAAFRARGFARVAAS